MSELINAELAPIQRLTRDMVASVLELDSGQVRCLVDGYYQMQEMRKATGNQTKALEKFGEPHETIEWFHAQFNGLEGQIKRLLAGVSMASEVGRWAQRQRGIGPVIAAGLDAYIDITKAPTVGHIWRFAGLDPTVEWGKGKKRPWNAQLKTLCWKIGESFVKVSGDASAFYGQIYVQRKALEVERNEAGAFADQAAAALKKGKYEKKTGARAAYEAGRLPPGHLHARAKRYAVKLFLAHWHEVAYREHFGEAPPKPYAIAQLGHAHYIAPPESAS